MEWEWEPEQRDLGGLGLAGICRETSRVVLRVILPNFANQGPPLLTALLLANADVFSCVANDASISRAVRGLDNEAAGTFPLRLVAVLAAGYLLHLACLLLLLLCAAAYVLCVASLYRTGGDLRAADRVLTEGLTVAPLRRLLCTFILFLALFTSFSIAAFLALFTSLPLAALLRVVEDKIVLPLWLLGWAGAACVAPVCHLACVVSVLEDAALLGAVRRSRELLAGKFWAAACVFVTLDGCVVALLMAFPALVVEDALGLGLGLAFRVAAGAALFLALCAVLVVTLVAQPVVYVVCKSHHQEVVDMAHLD